VPPCRWANVKPELKREKKKRGRIGSKGGKGEGLLSIKRSLEKKVDLSGRIIKKKKGLVTNGEGIIKEEKKGDSARSKKIAVTLLHLGGVKRKEKFREQKRELHSQHLLLGTCRADLGQSSCEEDEK